MNTGLLVGSDAFPFRSEVSLAPLIGFWEHRAADATAVDRALAQCIVDQLEKAPELRLPLTDFGVITRYHDLVNLLMMAVFPPAFREQELGAALVPFRLQSFYATPTLAHELAPTDGRLYGRLNMDEHSVTTYKTLNAYAIVLRRFYGIELDLEYPLIVAVPDGNTGWEYHFKVIFDSTFLTVDTVGELPPLPAEVRARLLANLSDCRILTQLLPPERFLFGGFTVFRAVDVTDQEILSSLKRELIERESIVSTTSFERLQDKLRAFFRRPGLWLGLAAIEGEQVLLLSHDAHIEEGCIFADSAHHKLQDFSGSIYEHAVRSGAPLIIEDLQNYGPRGPIEDHLLANGVRSIVVAPLHYQDQLIGTLELTSETPGDFNATHRFKLREVLPLFSIAVKRSTDELDTRVQAMIKEQFTAIHPSVEWRFRRAVLEAIEHHRGGDGGGPDVKPIVFEGVYPLYAASDVRGSSTERNLAIQADLAAHLRMAFEVLRSAHALRLLPALDALAYQVEQHLHRVEAGVTSGAELTVLAFLRQRVETLFEHLQGFGPEVSSHIDAYRASLDPRSGTVYRQRREFDESVTMLNQVMVDYLDAEQARAQAMFPHYFEKQQTDGVDFNIYVGASLVENGLFDPLYLHNLRLWQLMVLCGVARRTHALKSRLGVPLDTTHLVLVHSAPLAIRFRLDEKRFDVDGAYNVRYEVVKKRIDKAVLKGTQERLTQPGTIAIVYAQAPEAAEYREYIEYLQGNGYLRDGVEDLQLEDLQGVQGLRALRVGVRLDSPETEALSIADIDGAVREMTGCRPRQGV